MSIIIIIIIIYWLQIFNSWYDWVFVCLCACVWVSDIFLLDEYPNLYGLKAVSMNFIVILWFTFHMFVFLSQCSECQCSWIFQIWKVVKRWMPFRMTWTLILLLSEEKKTYNIKNKTKKNSRFSSITFYCHELRKRKRKQKNKWKKDKKK